jgi:Peptidase family C25
MQSVKLSITCRKALEKKYDAKALARIDAAIGKWIAADATRGIRTIHLAVDDPKDMQPYKVAPVAGEITAEKVKTAIDALVASLTPDYIVLLGSGDVVPLFDVTNPTLSRNGDTDPTVPTDNPYASSQAFDKKKRASYLVPNRVLGRIPDLPGSNEPEWLLEYLAVAAEWKSRSPTSYARDLLVCCDTWKQSGKECVEYLSRKAATLMTCPPCGDSSRKLKGRRAALLQMIKCHGAPSDSWFYGQRGYDYPEVMRSTSLRKRTRKATVVGSMCCFGANIFDPLDPAAQHPGEPPISSVYLRQGAFGFLGSTCTAWVGLDSMLCSDWIVAAFLKSVLAGASLGRATLEARQNLARWSQQQGDQVDSADEKTLIQFMLLGDPSIHPVKEPEPTSLATAVLLGTAPPASVALARRQRRATSHQLGAMLTAGIPERRTVKEAKVPRDVAGLARQLTAQVGAGFNFRLSAPQVERVVSRIPQPELMTAPAVALATAGMRTNATEVVGRKSLQYYWMARRDEGPVPDVRMVTIQTDPQGNVLRTQVLASS